MPEGGGLHVSSAAERRTSVTCFDTVFERNVAGIDGGGLRLASGGDLTLRGCTLVANEAMNRGGGISCVGQADRVSELTCLDSTLRGNRAGREGGGANINNFSRARLEGFEVLENAAAEWGGGLCVIGHASGVGTAVALERMTFDDPDRCSIAPR